MKSGRDSGWYVPLRTVSADGAIGPAPLSGFPSSTGTSFERRLVLLVRRPAGEAERELVAADALDQHVVVLARREVAAARLGLADDRLGEVVEGARVDAGAEQVDLAVGPGRSRTWFQRVILPCASGAQSVFSSATVIDDAQLFFGLTTTARPS